MKRMVCIGLFFCLLMSSAKAVELPMELQRAIPEAAEEILREEISGTDGFTAGIGRLLEQMREQAADIFRQRVRGAAMVLLIVALCGVVECFFQGAGGKASAFLPMAGSLSITIATAGSLNSLIGLGAETIRELSVFSKVLLPTLAAAAAVSGTITSATVHQVATVFFVELLISFINELLLPLVYLYIGVLTAACCIPENRLGFLAEGLKKAVTWLLTTVLLLFTAYLSVVRVISGTADSTAVKVAKTAISGVVPVVGSIIADASETVLVGAGLLKNTIGAAGMLTVLAVCAYPFLQLGIQYLLYKLTAVLASVIGAPELCKLISGLGGAFGLVLGMTGSCAMLLLISVLSSVAVVIT